MTVENALFSPLNAPAPDIGDTPETARIVDVGETVTGHFFDSPDGDRDMFGVTLEAGKIYAFEFDYTDASGHTVENYYTFRTEVTRQEIDPGTGLYREVRAYGDDANFANLPLKIDVTGTYFLSAWHRSQTVDGGAPYTFTVNEIFDDHGDTRYDATSLNVGETVSGSTDYMGDVDVFSIVSPGYDRYDINTTLGDGDGLDYIPFKVVDSDGNVVAEYDPDDPHSTHFATFSYTNYYVLIEHDWGQGAQELSLTHLGDYEIQIVESNKIVGSDRSQTHFGTRDDEIIYALDGDDTVFSREGNDVVYLDDGDDYVRAGGGREEFHGGAGNDTISYYESSKGVTINLATNEVSRAWASNDTISGFENVSGSKRGHDKIYGTDGANIIKTFSGNDKVYAGKGNDIVELGSGNDYVRVGGGREEFHGGAGRDTISYYDSKSGVNINLTTNEVSGSWATNDTISGFENVSGSKNGSDTIRGTSDANIIKTYGGNDTISSRAGDDTIYGGDGNDKIVAGDGDDKVYGGKGNDYVSLGAGNDYVKAGGGRERLDGGSGNDYISYYDSPGGIMIDLHHNRVSGAWASNDTINSFENASGSNKGSDVMLGTNRDNTMKGFGGNDRLSGRSGDDWLEGGSGNDSLFGGNGNDVLTGGTGNDRLDGGTGADDFIFNLGDGNDTITDFEDGIDTIWFVGFSDTDGDGYVALWEPSGDDLLLTADNGDTLLIKNTTFDEFSDDGYIV